MQLPEQYIKNMKELLGDEYTDYEASFLESRSYGLRINTSKITTDAFEHLSLFHLRKIPYIENGYVYDFEDQPSKHPYYRAGLYYLQEPSAMLPANRLPIEEGDFVLDLCAAPGGKSTELLAKLNGSGLLLANDISYSRAQALLKNLEMQGARNFYVTAEEPAKLAACFPSFFDKILIDAPCSGEGMFRKDSSLIKDWEAKGPAYYSEIQKEIVTQAVKMLKPGGMLLYSTCTFSEQEDECVIQALLAANPDISLVPMKKGEGFADGRRGMTDCIRIFPHKVQGEGHFLALMKKNRAEAEPVKAIKAISKKSVLPVCREFDTFMEAVSLKLDRNRLLFLNGMIYLLPEQYEISYKPQLRYLRSGTLLGEVDKGGKFIPDQAFAMLLDAASYENVLNLHREDERVIRYLKGETISCSSEETSLKKGYILICVDGFAIGWGKMGNMGMIKNKYKPGWRIMG